MHYNSNIVKIIFDPEIYMSILSEIVSISKSKSIDIYTIFLLNSIYMNEMLDDDIKWKDRTSTEYKEYINSRIRALIQTGIDLVNATKQTTESSIGSRKCNERQSSSSQYANSSSRQASCFSSQSQLEDIGVFDDQVACRSDTSLFDLVDSMPIDQNDEYYKKLTKYNKATENREKNNSSLFS